MSKPFYTPTTLYLVWESGEEPDPPPQPGDFFSSSAGKSHYEVTAVRRVKSDKIKYRLECLRVPESDVDVSKRWFFDWGNTDWRRK